MEDTTNHLPSTVHNPGTSSPVNFRNDRLVPVHHDPQRVPGFGELLVRDGPVRRRAPARPRPTRTLWHPDQFPIGFAAASEVLRAELRVFASKPAAARMTVAAVWMVIL